jgi:hypothetical protein
VELAVTCRAFVKRIKCPHHSSLHILAQLMDAQYGFYPELELGPDLFLQKPFEKMAFH